MDDTNGAAPAPNGKTYVKFGPRDTEEVPLEWATHMLSELARTNRSVFSKLLQSAVFAHLPEQDRARAGK